MASDAYKKHPDAYETNPDAYDQRRTAAVRGGTSGNETGAASKSESQPRDPSGPPSPGKLPIKAWREFAAQLIAYYETRIPGAGIGLTESSAGGSHVLNATPVQVTTE